VTSALDRARQVADAVLYEGYLLYPYRASSSKNQVRWQFGVLGPAGAVEATVGEEPTIYTECLLVPAGDDPSLDIHLRFLQTQWRAPQIAVDGDRFEPVDELPAAGVTWIAWHEAVEREISVSGIGLDELLAGREVAVAVPGGEDLELVHGDRGEVVGRLVRTRFPLVGSMRVTATDAGTTPPSVVVRVAVENTAALEPVPADTAREARRDLAARQSFVGTHLLLRGHDAGFVSMVDPPTWASDAVAGCGNARCWPVLAGARDSDRPDDESSDILLGSPIILGDYPEIAPESPGQLFDSAEIDEILTLRIMTLTDEEKAAARGTDARAAAIIDRSDSMPPEIFERLHGALRDLDLDRSVGREPASLTLPDAYPAGDPGEPDFPAIVSSFGPDGELTGLRGSADWFSEDEDASVTPETDIVRVSGVPISRGSRVRLCPNRRADAHDMFLAGQTAIVRRVDLDVDGQTHVAVLLDDDPASDLHEWHGRYYYFAPDEIEPIGVADATGWPT
jgi:hypothetical protein